MASPADTAGTVVTGLLPRRHTPNTYAAGMKRGFLSDSPEKTEPFTALHEWGPVDVKRAVKGSIDRIETGLQIWLLR